MYKSILIPVDDSQQSYAAVQTGGMMASCAGATVALLHVRRPPAETVTDIVTEDKLFALPLIEKEQKMFQKCKDILSGLGVAATTKVIESENVASEIIGECSKGHYDVIVIGHRGRSSLKQLMLGSVANGVLVEAKCPVIMVHVPFEAVRKE